LIARSLELSETEKVQLIRARRGQGIFRQGLEAIWESRCPVTGHSTRELLRASHIMPWRVADNRQRLDRYNGILLAANLDALFDKHLISFDDDGKLMISDLLPADEVRRLQLPQQTSISLRDEHKLYLRHHRLQFEQNRGRGLMA
jgi:predicted restriction endonuclease